LKRNTTKFWGSSAVGFEPLPFQCLLPSRELHGSPAVFNCVFRKRFERFERGGRFLHHAGTLRYRHISTKNGKWFDAPGGTANEAPQFCKGFTSPFDPLVDVETHRSGRTASRTERRNTTIVITLSPLSSPFPLRSPWRSNY
jgi:hypothetical protein